MDTKRAERMLRSINKISHEHFVLHGSLTRSNTLLPHKPSLDTFSNKRKTKGIRERAVYATRVTRIAVLYATLPHDTMWKLSRVRKGRYIHVLHPKPEIDLYNGFIHVCKAKSFDRRALITSSKRPAKVVRTFRITPDVFLYLWKNEKFRLFGRP